jgi:hypothetical protein
MPQWRSLILSSFLISYVSGYIDNFTKNSKYILLMIILFLNAHLVFAQTQTKEISDSPLNFTKITPALEITLSELGDTISIYPDSNCRLNQDAQINKEAIDPLWQSIVNKPYLERLSGLAILEQVKQRAQQSRMVITIDSDVETKLTIQTNEITQNISLYSIDLVHSTYPKAKLLSQFMEIVILMRKAKELCAG